MQADLITIAAHQLTPEQQKKLREIALEIAGKAKLDTNLYTGFQNEVAQTDNELVKKLESDYDIDRSIIDDAVARQKSPKS
jgi:hypothetical protein